MKIKKPSWEDARRVRLSELFGLRCRSCGEYAKKDDLVMIKGAAYCPNCSLEVYKTWERHYATAIGDPYFDEVPDVMPDIRKVDIQPEPKKAIRKDIYIPSDLLE